MQRADAARPPALLPGFGVLFEKEVWESRRSKRMIVFLLIMTGAVVLVPIIGYFRLDDFGSGGRHLVDDDGMDAMLGSWSALIGYLASLMVIASTVDAVTHERALGITAWITTKPVSRPSYLLAKASAHAAVASATLVLIPTLVWLVLSVLLFAEIPVAAVIVAAAILCVEVAFLSFVIVALGVAFRSVPPVAILALAIWFVPNFVPIIATLDWTYRVLPSYLPLAALSVAIEETEAATWTVPLASVVIAAAAFAVGVVWFERQEL